jgi:hypothetical protein
MRRTIQASVGVVACSILCVVAHGQSTSTTNEISKNPDDFVFWPVHVNRTISAKSWTDTIQDCAHDPLCNIAVSAAGAYMGIDTGTVVDVVGAIAPPNYSHEDVDFLYTLPSGYDYCGLSMNAYSVNPPGGNRASHIIVTAKPHGINVHTWTGRKDVFQGGRSWVHANFVIVGVKSEKGDYYRADGICKPNVDRVIVDCRGTKGGHGRPACGQQGD